MGRRKQVRTSKMDTNVDKKLLLQRPEFTINLKNILYPHEVRNYFKTQDIRKYCYAYWAHFPDGKIIMNIGMSNTANGGDRAYRKIGNIPGWGDFKLNGPNGSDMKKVIAAVEEKHNVKIHKDIVSFDFWDCTNVVNESTRKDYIVRKMECELADNCEELFGCLPAGNFKDPRTEFRHKGVSLPLFDSFFEEVRKEETIDS